MATPVAEVQRTVLLTSPGVETHRSEDSGASDARDRHLGRQADSTASVYDDLDVGQMGVEDAIGLIRSTRPNALANPDFVDFLRAFCG